LQIKKLRKQEMPILNHIESFESNTIDYELFVITPIKPNNELEYYIEFKEPENLKNIHIKGKPNEEMASLVEKIAQEFQELEEIRFYHKNYVIKLNEKQSKIKIKIK
jgi:hypothetical protein